MSTSSNNHIAEVSKMVGDIDAQSAAYERIEHAKTAAVLRRILAESASYLQTGTRKAAMDRIACTGNCVCLPIAKAQPADQTAPQSPDHVAGSGPTGCWMRTVYRREYLMATIEYRASPQLPCDVPKMKRAKLEDLAITQMATILDLEGKVAEARSVAEQACRQHNAMLEQKRRVTCIYCGHVYPDGTPESQAALLTAHVEQCHLHPLATARAEIGRLRSVVRDCARTLQHNLSMWAIKDEPMMMRSLESAWAAVGRGFCEAPSESHQASNQKADPAAVVGGSASSALFDSESSAGEKP